MTKEMMKESRERIEQEVIEIMDEIPNTRILNTIVRCNALLPNPLRAATMLQG